MKKHTFTILMFADAVLTICLTTAVHTLLARDGISVVDLMFLASFMTMMPLSLLSLLSMFLVPWHGEHASRIACLPELPTKLPSLGIIVPVYEEDIQAVSRRLVTTWNSLVRSVPRLAQVTRFYVLSDSDACSELMEKRVISEIQAQGLPVYYRRRLDRNCAKAGNVHEFLVSPAGQQLELIIGFDADSVMSGEAISRLVRIMLHPHNTDVGIVQAQLNIHAATSPIGLVEAWFRRRVGGLQGILLQRVLGGWNYFGHNYIARRSVMADVSGELVCDPVKGPFPGLRGYLASHDLAEGALASEKGYRVFMDDAPSGSYEEMPATFPELVARDSRWLRGSLQHIVGGWLLRGRSAQRHVLATAALQYASCVPAVISTICGLILIVRKEAFLGLTSPDKIEASEAVYWSYTPLPVVMLALTIIAAWGPLMVSMVWNLRASLPGPVSIRATAQQIACSLPEFIFSQFYGMLIGPIILAIRCRAVFELLWNPRPWRPNRSSKAVYPLLHAVRDLWWVCGLGLLLLVIASQQAIEIQVFMSLLGIPLACSPLIASAISSERLAALVTRAGLFEDVQAIGLPIAG